MPAVTVRNISDETHRALKARAAEHSRSTEAEIRAILDEATRPNERVLVGSVLEALGKKYGGIELDITRDQTPTEPAVFE